MEEEIERKKRNTKTTKSTKHTKSTTHKKRQRRKKQPRKQSKFWHYLYASLILLMTIAIITLSVLILSHVQTIEISGTTYSQKKDILEWLEEDPYTSNSIYTFWKFKTGRYEKPEYLEKVDIGLSVPWKLNVKVTEKKIAACMLHEGEYIYIDNTGLVLDKAMEKTEGLPFVEGVPLQSAERYQKVGIEQDKILSYIVELTEVLKKQELEPDRIVWEEDSLNPYFSGICVRLGKSGFEEKLVQLPSILEKLMGKTGVLQMEHYNETSKSISFREEVPANP